MRTLIVALALTGSAFAAEYAVLGSGFRLHIDRHTAAGAMIQLYSGDGVTELPASAITSFEADETPALVVAVPPAAAAIDPRTLIDDAARRHGLPRELVHSVVRVESAYRPDAVSRKGAIGLMQLMPETAKAYGANPAIPEENVEAGTQYLKDLLLKYQATDHQVSRAIAAYNAGPGAVDRYDGVPPYAETQDYVARVLRDYEKRRPISLKTPGPSSPLE